MTQFSVKNCDAEKSGSFQKTCHCAEEGYIYGRQSLTQMENAQSELADAMAGTWGEYFRTGRFLPNTILSEVEDGQVNLIDSTKPIFKQTKTFENECAALDTGLCGNYNDVDPSILQPGGRTNCNEADVTV